jgi:FkbM family methyltransferase
VPVSDRLGLLPAFVSSKRDFPVQASEVLAKGIFKRTCGMIGPHYIEGMEDDGDFLRVAIKGIGNALYWPKQLGLFDLYKACTDCLYESDWHHYEVPETTVAAGDTVLDCGAAEGLFALSVLDRAGRVVIFEPWVGFQESLRRTFGGYPKAFVHQQALGERKESAFLSGSALYGVVSYSEGQEIEIVSVDSWRRDAGGRVDYIKADLEGFEMSMLKGAVETIARDKPKIAITVYHAGNDWREMLALLKRLVPEYKHRVKGLSFNANSPRPVMLHVWRE